MSYGILSYLRGDPAHYLEQTWFTPAFQDTLVQNNNCVWAQSY